MLIYLVQKKMIFVPQHISQINQTKPNQNESDFLDTCLCAKEMSYQMLFIGS